jgi:hypothetical protein
LILWFFGVFFDIYRRKKFVRPHPLGTE